MLYICNCLTCKKHLPHQTTLPIFFLRQKPLRTYISNTLICLQLLSTYWMVQNICGKETGMNNNLNFYSVCTNPPQTPLSPTSMRTQFLLSIARNVISLLSLMTRTMLYIYTGWQWKYLFFMSNSH